MTEVAANRRTGSRAGDPQEGGGVLRRRSVPGATGAAAAMPVAAPDLISRGTVKTHLLHVFAKLGVHTRAELAADAIRHGLG
jgi:Bacterial regulatory proteins, luxR family